MIYIIYYKQEAPTELSGQPQKNCPLIRTSTKSISMIKHVFRIKKTDTGFSAWAADKNIPVGTTGKDMTELKQNILHAMNLYQSYKGFNLVSESDISIR